MKKVLRSVVLVVGLGVVLTSCYKGKYEDQLLLNDELVAKNVALNTTISGLNANVVSLNDEINSNNVAIDGLENKITSLGDEINGLIADGNADQGIIDGLNDEIAINEALLDVVRTSLVVLDELAAGIELEIIALNENADVNANEIASLRADLGDALELEATLRNRIANDAINIASLTSQVANLQADLDAALLDADVLADDNENALVNVVLDRADTISQANGYTYFRGGDDTSVGVYYVSLHRSNKNILIKTNVPNNNGGFDVNRESLTFDTELAAAQYFVGVVLNG